MKMMIDEPDSAPTKADPNAIDDDEVEGEGQATMMFVENQPMQKKATIMESLMNLFAEKKKDSSRDEESEKFSD